MKKTFDHAHQLTLSVRTESGTVSIDVGIQWLTSQERKFLFQLVKRAKEGGTIGFGVDPGENGSSIIKLELAGKVNEAPVNGAAA
jgi:hypothetical protein